MQNSTTYSQKRVKQLRNRSEQIGKVFKPNNFYEGNQINLVKLRVNIEEAKKNLMRYKQKHRQFLNRSSIQQKQQPNPYINSNIKFKNEMVSKLKQKGLQIYQTIDDNKCEVLSHKRIVSDLGDYQFNRKRTLIKNEADKTINSQIKCALLTPNSYKGVYKHCRMNRFSSVDIPTGRNTKSVQLIEVQTKKIVINEKQKFKQFEMKISILWELYEMIVQMMQHASKTIKVNQKLVSQYIAMVNSEKLQFIHEIYQQFNDVRVERTIKLSRVLENFSVFETCLNSLPKKKAGAAQIINYLGYSSSSVIFLIKILLLTVETSMQYSPETKQIVQSIIQFEIKSYKIQLRDLKQVLRRLQHNNEIIGMIKTKCGKKHGKCYEQFLSKIIKSVEKLKFPFYQCANNIFQFLSFYLHYENIEEHLPLLSTPPTPFLSLLPHPKTIIIEPWEVLVYKKNRQFIIRPSTGTFLTEIYNKCNIVFWTQLMPKDAQYIADLLPIKVNIHWLYRYHCRQEKNDKVKDIEMIGCDEQNTIVIDSTPAHYLHYQDIGVSMEWAGERNDTKLLRLLTYIQQILEQSNKNNTSFKQQLEQIRSQINKLARSSKRLKSKSRVKSSLKTL